MVKADISQLKDIHLPPIVSLTMPDIWVIISIITIVMLFIVILIILWWRQRNIRRSLKYLKKIKLDYDKNGEAANFIINIKILIKNHANTINRNNFSKNLYGEAWNNFIIRYAQQPLPNLDWHKIWHQLPYQSHDKVYLQKSESDIIYNFVKIWLKKFYIGDLNV